MNGHQPALDKEGRDGTRLVLCLIAEDFAVCSARNTQHGFWVVMFPVLIRQVEPGVLRARLRCFSWNG